MKIYVVRHAIAEDREEFAQKGTPDEERPLTEAGKKKMQKAAKGLTQVIEAMPLILTSPLKRASQTAKILHKKFESAEVVEVPELSPENPPEATTAALRQLVATGKADSIAIVGHEPHLGTLVSYWLSGSAKNFAPLKKGSVTLVEFKDSPAAGQGRLRWSIPAAILGRIDD